MDIRNTTDGIEISTGGRHRSVTIIIKFHPEGIIVKNKGDGKTTAVRRKRIDKDSYLFTSAEPIQDWVEFDTLI